jgi:hypothetical protein
MTAEGANLAIAVRTACFTSTYSGTASMTRVALDNAARSVTTETVPVAVVEYVNARGEVPGVRGRGPRRGRVAGGGESRVVEVVDVCAGDCVAAGVGPFAAIPFFFITAGGQKFLADAPVGRDTDADLSLWLSALR